MKKAINFDIDTKKYEEYTQKKSPNAYKEIKRFLKKSGFEHRQGSGYISKENMNDSDIIILITNMTLSIKWLKHCIKQIDVTNIGKQHSLVDMINKISENDELQDLDDIEI